jgi:hypothetical protein
MTPGELKHFPLAERDAAIAWAAAGDRSRPLFARPVVVLVGLAVQSLRTSPATYRARIGILALGDQDDGCWTRCGVAAMDNRIDPRPRDGRDRRDSSGVHTGGIGLEPRGLVGLAILVFVFGLPARRPAASSMLAALAATARAVRAT